MLGDAEKCAACNRLGKEWEAEKALPSIASEVIEDSAMCTLDDGAFQPRLGCGTGRAWRDRDRRYPLTIKRELRTSTRLSFFKQFVE